MFLKILKNSLMEAAMDGDAAAGGSPGEPVADGAPAEGAPQKPEGLEDSFWDADKGEIRLDSLIKSHNDTKAAFSSKEETLREKIMAELNEGKPESADKYEIAQDLGIEAPEGFEIKFDDDDPMILMWREIAHKSGLNNDQFNEGIKDYVNATLSQRPNMEAELKSLGENGKDRINRMDNLMRKHLSEEQVGYLSDLLLTAKGVESLEKLVLGVNSNSFANVPTDASGDTGGEKVTRASLEAMMQDPKYTGRGGMRDPDFIAQVNAGFAKLYPGKASVGQHR